MSLEAPAEALIRVVAQALSEDLGDLGDVTTTSIGPAGTPMTGVIRSREAGRIAGVDAIRFVLSQLPELRTPSHVNSSEGKRVRCPTCWAATWSIDTIGTVGIVQ